MDQALARCEVVVCLISPAWDASQWCFYECQHAKSLHKLVLGVVLKEVPPERLGPKLTSELQTCRLAGPGPKQTVQFSHGGTEHEVEFLAEGLQRLRAGLDKARLSTDRFPWPPKDDPHRSPVPGLEPLDVHDAAVFFGRDVEILRGLEALRGLRDDPAKRLFVILGASGTGKSSFLRAGLLPRLARDDRHFLPLLVVRPEKAPISGDRGLAQALSQTMRTLDLPGSTPGALKERLSGAAGEFTSILR